MGRRRGREKKASTTRSSQTLPPSPSYSFSPSSSSSSDFEFSISISPRKSSSTLCPADELFYKGQLLPLHLSPRISLVRSLLLASSSSSSDTTTTTTDTTTASRDSTGSTSSSGNDSNFSFSSSDLVLLAECDSSSRPSSATEDDEFRKLNGQQIKKVKYFSLTRLFKKDNNNSPVKRMSSTAKEVIRKYLKKVKPLYEKFSQKQQKMEGVVKINNNTTCVRSVRDHLEASAKNNTKKENSGRVSHSFSGNLRYPTMRRKTSYVSSCPSSMRSSPSHSGILSRNGFSGVGVAGGRVGYTDRSSMEELQSAIQGAIAHCKNSMNKSLVGGFGTAAACDEVIE